MSYSYSQVDRSNFRWFNQDASHNTLLKLELNNGQIRGITPFVINFEYPITAIVGENGSGKSTVLALATCAFHNSSDFVPQSLVSQKNKKKKTKEVKYYTYSDFFTFSANEQGFNDIEITATYLSQSGIKSDTRKKRSNGKWNDYNRRPVRVVSYMGINRILPPSESKTHKNYRNSFTKSELSDEQINLLKNSVSSIFGKPYNEIDLLSHNSYRLYEAHRNGVLYTGFNMGAGENAVVSLLLEILSAGKGSLIIIDEVELGLHVQAQIRLIDELKKMCKKYKCQIIFSTHSKEVLDNLPPEARIFIKNTNSNVEIIPQISSQYAFGKLSGCNSCELDVFVEDTVGQTFLQNCLHSGLRERVSIIPIGSDQAILRQIAAHYREDKHNYVAFLDGDKRTAFLSAKRTVENCLETRLNHTQEEFDEYINRRLNYLPGNEWPERVLVEFALKTDNIEFLEQAWDACSDDIIAYLEEALTASKHSEFYQIASRLCLTESEVRRDLIQFYKANNKDTINGLAKILTGLLE